MLARKLAYYNENDARAAAWLRELIKAGHIALGHVDERSIEDVIPSDLDGYAQCHFFAGIGGWSYALRLASWPDDRAVWTGSCPCQPFSAAGKGAGFADERHLWPAWFHLIRACRPQRIFGEQVASAMQWIDLVQGDLEAEGHACGYAVLGAHSVGAPHIRQRIYWVADRDSERFEERREHYSEPQQQQHPGQAPALGRDASGRGAGGVADSNGRDASAERQQRSGQLGLQPQGCGLSELADWGRLWRVPDESFITGPDGKRRPIKPGLEPLVAGLPGRVGLLRGYGNAIVPQVAAAFIGAYLGVR